MVDLDGARARQERLVREVGAEQDDQVGGLHRLVAGAVPEQPAHPHVEGVVVLDPLLAAQRVPDRGQHPVGELHHLAVRVPGARAAEQHHLARPVERLGELLDLVGGRPDDPGPDEEVVPAGRVRRLLARGVAGQGQHRHAVQPDRVLDRGAHDPRQLLRAVDHLAVVAAIDEQPLGMGLLEVAAADLGAGDLRGQREHRRAGAVRVVQALDQVGVAGAAASGADREPPGDLRLGGGGERAGLLVAHVYPLDAVGAADGVHDRVEAVAHDPVDPPHSRLEQHLDELLGDRAHALPHLTGSRGRDGGCHRPRALGEFPVIFTLTTRPAESPGAGK